MRIQFAGIVLFLAGTSWAAPVGYGLDLAGNLKTVDLATGASSNLGPTGLSGVAGGLASSATGQLYASATTGSIYKVANNGTTTFFTALPGGGSKGLDFQVGGPDLIATNLLGGLLWFYQIGTNGSISQLGANSQLFDFESLAMTTLYDGYAVTSSGGGSNLYRINAASGMVLPVMSIPHLIHAIDFAPNGTMYGLGWAGDTFSIDPIGGTYQHLAHSGFEDWQGLTFAVPEPSSLLVLGLAFAGLIRRRKA